jgi:toxin HigB-1
VIVSFADQGTEDVYNGVDSKDARKICPGDIVRTAVRKLAQLNQAVKLEDIRVPPGNRLEKLRGDREGRYSIRVNDQYRVCFAWSDSGAEEVQIIDYH